MVELAEIVGLEEQLTVPSRGNTKLVDLWIAIKRCSAGPAWEQEFTRLATREQAKLSPTGTLQVIPFTERRGWVVARGVDDKSMSPRDVEALVQTLVAEANARLSAPAVQPIAETGNAPSRESWAERVRSVITDGGAPSPGSPFQTGRDPAIDIRRIG